MEKRIEKLLKQMTLEEKVSMLSGTDFWHTQSIERLGIPTIKVTDGPYGDRTMDEDSPNHTLPATCFPTGARHWPRPARVRKPIPRSKRWSCPERTASAPQAANGQRIPVVEPCVAPDE